MLCGFCMKLPLKVQGIFKVMWSFVCEQPANIFSLAKNMTQNKMTVYKIFIVTVLCCTIPPYEHDSVLDSYE